LIKELDSTWSQKAAAVQATLWLDFLKTRNEMKKPKRKLTATERARKRQRREVTMLIFINGKQKRVKRPPNIDGMDADEFIRLNADPIWLYQNEMWEYIESDSRCIDQDPPNAADKKATPMMTATSRSKDKRNNHQ
jgi:hypothetical protein